MGLESGEGIHVVLVVVLWNAWCMYEWVVLKVLIVDVF